MDFVASAGLSIHFPILYIFQNCDCSVRLSTSLRDRPHLLVIRSVRPNKSHCFSQHATADGSFFIISNPGCRSFVALPRATNMPSRTCGTGFVLAHPGGQKFRSSQLPISILFPHSLHLSKLLLFRPKLTYHLFLACSRGRLFIHHFQPGVSLLRRLTPGY